ncbi:helix-turn-helix transcriptional regulator [Fuchsiella alkaliacetigena]|uniref:helix-turn-helix transcriptional regulator n=1 Tax=Fuchsiella alkaliacetigena TaxID=957042 RepID=UPI00200AE305|nr:WYL domain-containing protein [Fuchsiella alkaliacetigena]MCK8825703.1 WYL domain-containing protein [Fuchsiella alkaliacetigena]
MSELAGKVGRLIEFVTLLDGKYAIYSRQDIMDRLGISESSFYRYRTVLEEAGVIIDCIEGCYKIRGDCRVEIKDLSIPEALALIVGSNALLNDGDITYFKQMKLATAKIKKELSEDLIELATKLEERVNIDLKLLVKNNVEVINTIDQAIREEVNLWIKYYTYTRDEISERVLSPYVIDCRNGFLYLIAYCHWRDEVKVFRIDRIKEIEVTEDEFKYPDDFSLKDYLGDAWGVERRKETLEVKVKFKEKLARWIKGNKYHPSQEVEELPDGSLLVTVETCSKNEIKKWILGFGKYAEVLAPESLKEEIIAEIEEMRRFYL